MSAHVPVEEKQQEKNIVITGFGIFRDHKQNPSWEAIRDDKLKINQPNLKLVTEQIDVSYETVDKVIPELWKKYDPILMIHVGLAAHDEDIRLEQFARHGPYINDDVRNHAPHRDLRQYGENSISFEENIHKRDYSCLPCNFDCSTTCIDVDKVCELMNQAHEEGKLVIPTRKSLDAGLYVCEYIYHKSLLINERCIFIHVPDTKIYKLEDITASLQCILDFLVDETIKQESIRKFNESN